MKTGVTIRAASTLLAIACLGYLVFFVEPADFPFDWQSVDDHTLSIEARPGTELPPGFEEGDRLDLRLQDLRTRAAMYARTMPDETYQFRIERAGRIVSVPAREIPLAEAGLGKLHDATLLLVLILGLTTLWWGRDWAAWGLTVFAFGTLLNFFLYYLPLPSVAAFLAVLLNQMLVGALLPIGLYVSAVALSGPAVAGRLRAMFHFLLVGVVVVNAALLSASTIGYIVYSNLALEQTGVMGMLFAVSICVPLVVLVVALARADAARRLRLRWVLFSLVLFIGPIAWNNLAQFSDAFTTAGVVRQLVWWSALLGGLGGLLYAVLRKRVVAMSFAINRALVYGLVVALVVGVFGVLTAVLENTTIGTDAGLALTVGVSLGIGLVLEWLRDRINLMVERVFFRRRFEAETALRRFPAARASRSPSVLRRAAARRARCRRIRARVPPPTVVSCASGSAAQRTGPRRLTWRIALSSRRGRIVNRSPCGISRAPWATTASPSRWRSAAG